MEQLFGSKTRVKLLKLFMSNPNRSFYVREITRKIDEQINSVRRELSNLLKLGVITSDSSDSSNNKLYYEVNQKYEYYEALRDLFTGGKRRKTAIKTEQATAKSKPKDDADKQARAETEATMVDSHIWDKVGNIVGLIYSGTFTRDDNSPIDILVIGNVTSSRIDAAVAELEKQENRELRYAIMDMEEWGYRRQLKDKFWSEVMGAKNQILADRDSLFKY